MIIMAAWTWIMKMPDLWMAELLRYEVQEQHSWNPDYSPYIITDWIIKNAHNRIKNNRVKKNI